MHKKLFLNAVISVAFTSIFVQTIFAQNTLTKVDKQFFIENRGQWPNEVLYLSNIGCLDVWITRNGVVYDFFKLEEAPSSNVKDHQPVHDKLEHTEFTRTGHIVMNALIGCKQDLKSEGIQKQETYYNYILGTDTRKHAANVGLYKEALIKNVYDGIDIRYYFDQGSIRYDYIVSPHADPSQIGFTLEGTENSYLNQKDNLAFSTRFGEMALAELLTYQGSKENKIASHFVKTANNWSIAIGDYDHSRTLIIDPLIYSTFIGANLSEKGYSIAIDSVGSAFVTGVTNSTIFPTAVGAYQTTLAGSNDLFVTKLNPSGSSVIYSTFLGGVLDDYVSAIAIDASGNAFVVGEAYSIDFPTTVGVFQTTNAGDSEAFVTKLNASGTALVYSTYLGGSLHERANAIAVDNAGNAFVTGTTLSTNFPSMPGAYQLSLGGGSDAFVAKLNATCSGLIYSTYLGGSNFEEAISIAVDAGGSAFVAGHTGSIDLPCSPGAYQTVSGGGGLPDGFVAKLNVNGSGIIYSTYLGGSSTEIITDIAVDAVGTAFLTGKTESPDFPVIAGAYQTMHGGGIEDAFVTQLNASGTALIYSTYFGGTSSEFAEGIAIDANGSAYIAGAKGQGSFPTTPDAYQTTPVGVSTDGFIAKFNPTGTTLTYSTLLGTNAEEIIFGLALNNTGNPFVTGYTRSANFPTTTGSYQNTYAGSNDVFVTKLELPAPAGIAESVLSGNFIFYPNPASVVLTIEGVKGKTMLEIYDMAGRLIKTKFHNTKGNLVFDVQNLANGVYILKINSNDGISQSSKLVIER